MTAHAPERVLFALTWTRWFGTGLLIPILTLYMLERGLSVAQVLTVTAVTGLVTMVLELPTSSFADLGGRRRLYLLAAAVNVVAGLALLMAGTFAQFIIAAALMGVSRALDSGPLEAWFVDAARANDPRARVDGALSAAGTVLGVAIASGALLSAALVWWSPLPDRPALWLPVSAAAAWTLAHLSAVTFLMRDESAPGHVRSPSEGVGHAVHAGIRVMRDSARLVRLDHVLLCLLLAEACWSIAVVVFEQFLPLRLAEVTGSQEHAAVLTGPLAAGAWAAFSAGSALAGLLARRIGVARTAILARALNGLGAAAMGLVTGSGGLAATYLLTYALHGSNGPMHAALLHDRAEPGNRSTILSINSLVAFGALSVSAPLLGLIAGARSTPVAMVVGGLIGILGAVFYLPARAAETRTPCGAGHRPMTEEAAAQPRCG